MKLLFVGDSPTVHTGFGTVSKNLLGRLHNLGYEVTVLGINFFGEPYDREQFPYDIYPCDRGPIDMLYGYRKLWHIAEQLKPDIMFFLNDPWVIQKYLDVKPKNFNDTYIKYFAYYPIDGGPLKPEWAKMLTEEFDAQICYSKFAEGVVIEANEGKRPKNLYQIYHGVDTSIFYPIAQQETRLRLGLPQDAFIVGMIARNQYRKRFDILVKAFARFAQDKPNTKLYLHTAIQDVGFDINDLSRQFDLGDKLILTEDMQLPIGVSDEALNFIHNTFDVNALFSMGDGFGLPVAESMACGTPQLVSDHSCLKELVEGHGGLTVKNSDWILNVSGINTWGAITDYEDAAIKLNTLYNSLDLRRKFIEDGFNFIKQDKFNWDHIALEFDQIIKSKFHIIKAQVKSGVESEPTYV